MANEKPDSETEMTGPWEDLSEDANCDSLLTLLNWSQGNVCSTARALTLKRVENFSQACKVLDEKGVPVADRTFVSKSKTVGTRRTESESISSGINVDHS